MGRAVSLAEKLLNAYKTSLAGVELVPSGGGVFEVDFDGDRVFSKRDLGRFPEEPEILEKAQSKLGATAAH